MTNPLKKNVKTAGAPSNAQQRADLFQRVDVLEHRFTVLKNSVQSTFQKLFDSVTNLGRVVDAVSEILGNEQVAEKTLEIRVRELEEVAAAEAAGIAASVEKGELKAGTVVTPASIVVTAQYREDGIQLVPSRVSLPMDAYKPEVKELLTDKKVGESIPLPDGGRLDILEVFDVVLPAAPEASV